MAPAKISIIIPVLNEADRIWSTLSSIQSTSNHVEIIVVDGGSRDKTVTVAESFGVKVLSVEPGRARQMNAGAAVARGEILLFLHADTRLPAEFEILIYQALGETEKYRKNSPQLTTAAKIQNPIAGAFKLKIDAQLKGLQLVEKMVNLRSRLLGMPYGDQAIFLKSAVFRDIGGFPDLPILEDFELILHLRRLGQIVIVPASVLTSGRRWQKLGVLKTTLINQLIILGYFLGVAPTQLAHWYRSFLR